ncbi:MAG: hypothetical protein NTY40_04845 [Synechococcus sp. LacPavin_0920_WC12_MAG_50_7]|nr:hypothetical protein [Synechococcus sp. LacPavin_0920_WC12_MAG_50_7]
MKHPLPLSFVISITAAAVASCAVAPPLSNNSIRAPLPPLQQPPAKDPRFTALPTPAAVIAALPKGRNDPFAPLAATTAPKGANPPKSLAKPALQLTGVAMARGVPQAFVSYNNETGAVVPGDLGGAGIPWLPPGWRVISVDVQQGQLMLGNGSQKLPFQL